MSVEQVNVTLLDLSNDLLRSLAYWLPPSDCLNLAMCNKRLFSETWGSFGLSNLTRRFPFERRLSFPLDVNLRTSELSLRKVPERARQQHAHVAISNTGNLVAAVTFDGVLRLFCVRTRMQISSCAETRIVPHDLWDVSQSRRHGGPVCDAYSSYADKSGIDAEASVLFSEEQKLLLAAGRASVTVHAVPKLETLCRANLEEVLQKAKLNANNIQACGSAAVLSPNGTRFAWIVYAGAQTRAFVSVHDARSGKCESVTEVFKADTRRWSALIWGRLAWTKNGDKDERLAVIVNTARRVVRTLRVGERYVKEKLCKFVIALFECENENGKLNLIASREEWLELDATKYPAEIASCFARLFRTRQRDSCEKVSVNALHTCPAEGTYKSLEFCKSTRRPWFVTKQPMYSMHFLEGADRVVVATSPHTNDVIALRRIDNDRKRFGLGKEVDCVNEDYVVVDEEEWQGEVGRKSVFEGRHRTHAFSCVPWRKSFATVTAFSANGRWLAAAALVDDECVIGVRNLTDSEYYGRDAARRLV